MCAVRGKKSTFDVNSVTFDFYYGYFYNREGDGPPGSKAGSELICYAIYFSNNNADLKKGSLTHSLVDYRNIEGFWFVKELSPEEFGTGDYAVKVSLLKKTFKHHETLKPPEDVFAIPEGNSEECTLDVWITSVQLNKYGYFWAEDYSVSISYKYTDNSTVRLGNKIPRN